MVRLILILAIVLYPLFFIWQGLDFTDTGFMLTNFQQIFNDPTSVETSSRLWLTNIIGGVWVYFFGDSLGLLGYRIAALILVWSTLFLTYNILRPYIYRTNLLVGLLLAEIVINRMGYQFNYNSLTAFFYLLAVYFLLKGLKEDRNNFIFITGMVLALNIFIRLPNILGFTLVLSIFFYGYIQKSSLLKSWKQFKYFLAGYLTASGLTLIIMYGLGHLKAYLVAFQGTFYMLGDSGGHHSSAKLSNLFLTHHERVLGNLGFVIVSFLILGLLLKITKKLKLNYLAPYVIIGFFTGYSFYFQESYQNWFRVLITFLGIIYLIHILILIQTKERDEKYNQDYRLLGFLSLLILFLTPLGSNVGVYNSVYGMYLAIPITLHYIWSTKEITFQVANNFNNVSKRVSLGLPERDFLIIKVISILILIAISINSTYFYTYRETKYRDKLVYSVDHPRLKGVFTTKERAKVVEELVQALPRYVKKDDYLLTYEQIPMVYFLTKTRPYLYGSWPMLYNPHKFRKSLERSLREKEELPVIVRAKGSTESFVWPKTVKLSKNPNLEEIRDIMRVYISENDYKLAWENSFFEILTPN